MYPCSVAKQNVGHMVIMNGCSEGEQWYIGKQ